MRIVLIGAGNLATRLGIELLQKGEEIIQIYSRTKDSAKELADKIGTNFTTQLSEIDETADLYIFSVKDDALPTVLGQMKPNNGLWVHTAGSVPISIFESYTDKFGAFYPLQTFSKKREVNFSLIPIYIESHSAKQLAHLKTLAHSISETVIEASSEQRKQIHLAAVFACNFTNRMYAIAAQLLEEKGLDFTQLLPLIDETASKVHELHPKDAQTGPAIRFDEKIINKHIDSLKDGELKLLYYSLSENIYNEHKRVN
ncbi:MAG: DUF2520 domain-containing protein [Bacteroidales bacterium]|nr:DUF2520 domain-containing protein [Bacteroidales bacterium]